LNGGPSVSTRHPRDEERRSAGWGKSGRALCGACDGQRPGNPARSNLA
jgi:hypothetical protein